MDEPIPELHGKFLLFADRLTEEEIEYELVLHDGPYINVGNQLGWWEGEYPMATFTEEGDVMARLDGYYYSPSEPVIRAIVIASEVFG